MTQNHPEAFDMLAKQCAAAEYKLKAWHHKIDDGKSFQPVIKAEWDRAFDRREMLKTRLCGLDPQRFALLYPDEPNDRHL